MGTNVTCPSCKKATLEIVTDGGVGVLVFEPALGRAVERIEARPFAACPACEYCVDLTDADPALLKGRAA